jgi:hypothetical protein
MADEKENWEMLQKFLEEEVLDKMVEDGIFRVIGINEKGRKIYARTEACAPHKKSAGVQRRSLPQVHVREAKRATLGAPDRAQRRPLKEPP